MRSRGMGFWALVVLIAAVALCLVGWAVFGPTASVLPWGWGHRGMGPGMMPGRFGEPWVPLMRLSMLLFWVGAIIILIALVRFLVPRAGGQAAEVDALELARRRYARGEINRDEFERLRDDLTATGPAQ
jgi:putative membrane protein